MLNTLASKILPHPAAENSRVLDEQEISRWSAQFKQALDKLASIHKELAILATYWSVYFDNIISGIRPLEHDESTKEHSQRLGKLKAETEKSLTEFDKKLLGRLKDIRTYIESQQKLLKRREDKKIEISKYTYYYNLYSNKETASKEDENALQLTGSEKNELENFKVRLNKCDKDMARLENQIAEAFPLAMATYNDFTSNISDMIYYDQLEIYNHVNQETELVKLPGQDLSSIYRQIAGLRSSGKPTPDLEDSKPKEKSKLSAAGMRSLNLDPKKSTVRRSTTMSHRRTGSKGMDLKTIVADENKAKRQSVRSFSSFLLEEPPLFVSKDDDTYSFTSSASSLEQENSSLTLSPANSPKRFSGVPNDLNRLSSTLSPNSDTIRLPLFSPTNNRVSTILSKRLAEKSPINETMLRPIDTKIRNYVTTTQSMSADVFLNCDFTAPNKLYDYRYLKSRNNKKLLDPVKTAIAVSSYTGCNVGQLSFDKDDRLTVLAENCLREGRIDKNWWVGKSEDGRVGKFPKENVTVI